MSAPNSEPIKNNLSDKIEISYLLSKYLTGDLLDKEQERIEVWLQEDESHSLLLEELLHEENWAKRQRLLEKIEVEKEWARFQLKTNLRTGFFRTKGLKMLKYAAILLLPLALGVYIWLRNSELPSSIVSVPVEIEPGVKRAQLILSNGQRIDISDQALEIQTAQNGVAIENRNKVLNYRATSVDSEVDTIPVFNQLIVSRGEEYQLMLSDGTRVWLNSETRLTYPTHFAPAIREVELEGEAYFEVTKNPNAPFIVKTKALNVEVLGTSFNVSAYDDENTIQTTLVEGMVKIQPNLESTQPAVLRPNEQAEFSKLTQNMTIRETDARMYTRWTKGEFAFDEETLEEIMNKLARWYDISVTFQDEKARKSQFSGRMPRFENCNELLEMIEKTTDVSFTINENQDVIISINKQ